MHFIVIKKRSLVFLMLLLITAVSASFWFYINTQSAIPSLSSATKEAREIHLVTGEFKAATKDGKTIEAYRWDPGTIFVKKDEKIAIRIYGVNGAEHPFIIEGTDIKGTVKKAEETVIETQFTKDGIYRLICLTHPDKEHNGPMIAYIVVE